MVHKRIHPVIVQVLRLVPLLLLCTCGAHAQYRLKLSSPDFTRYPLIELPFEIIDNTSAIDTIRADAIRVFENGKEMQPVQVECGGYTVAQKIHFMFLMDVSYSMAFREGSSEKDPDSVKWRTAKRVFNDAYRSLRDTDEAALASFAADFDVEQFFTTDKKALTDATMGMALRSGTAIYDAVVNAVSLLEQREGKRVIILLTDGVDNWSQSTLRQAVNMAWGRGIPVHVIGLGFYVDQTDPFRVDKDTLQAIADGTGGKAYFTAKSEELAEIFERIIKSIYTVSCVARYTSPDTCSDGAARVVSVQATVKGSTLIEQVVYTLPDLRSRLRLHAAFPSEATHEQVYSIPLLAEGEIRPGQQLHADFTFRYDPAHLEFRGLDATPALLNPADVTVNENPPGELHFSVAGAMPVSGLPYGSPQALFTMNFYVPRHDTIATTSMSLAVGGMYQNCTILGTGSSQSIRVQGCPAELSIVLDTTVIALPGSDFYLPVYLKTDLDPRQSVHTVFTIVHGPEIEYLGYSLKGTILEGADITLTQDAGLLSFEAYSAMPALRSGVLLYLRLRAAKLKEAGRADFTLLVSRFTQQSLETSSFVCNPPIRISGADVWIDGICAPLVRRKAITVLQSVYPQPITSADAAVGIDFSSYGVGAVSLRVVDASGKTVSIITDGMLPDGKHSVLWHTGALPPGMYFIVLRQDDAADSRKILIQR
ncbi:MAG: VWA domain-containing protein [Bacteroidia bacterium]|nr:VWA domain-containing protein [Bacteroidia bacterium]